MSNPMKTVLAAALAFGLAAPAFAQDSTADTVVATVGGQDITLGEMIVMTGQLPPEYQALEDGVLFDAILEQLVRQTAVAQTAEAGLSKASLLALANERRAFIAGVALNEIAEGAVTEEAIAKAYDEKFASVEAEPEFNASHILVETQEEAAAIKAELENGGDFAALAKEKSTGPSGPSGGALGWFSKGMMVKPFEDAVIALETGTVSDPVETQFGWHIILLNEARDKPKPELDAVREQIAGELQQAAVDAAIADITEKANVVRPETAIDPAALRNQELLAD
ncbi:peptidylprolyl isomerase [Actibacterium lipolyticum]|uniref:Parvulin-like PPIase n=1 Tax=Actibacterium lipolyticum TaxID=1524263 RepID=A0A238KVU1_9RHOB|nr:peptidylprolyl isomerase [Actibacterium lipolyticum]SMX46899.1 putative parvulin-type peptidyl-prolyl cis-trans isomerase precursor [Actibacterium lipolyticum]